MRDAQTKVDSLSTKKSVSIVFDFDLINSQKGVPRSSLKKHVFDLGVFLLSFMGHFLVFFTVIFFKRGDNYDEKLMK